MASQRAQGKTAIATASSGLTTSLLSGEKNITEHLQSSTEHHKYGDAYVLIKKGTTLSLLIIDEATVLHRKVVVTEDRTFRDIRSSTEVMIGLLKLFSCGDFRQILLVIKQGTRAKDVDVCLKSATLWCLFQKYKLTTNMRVALQANTGARALTDKLLRLGNGETDAVSPPDSISLQSIGTLAENSKTPLETIYPEIEIDM